jgi:hypothetical protein
MLSYGCLLFFVFVFIYGCISFAKYHFDQMHAVGASGCYGIQFSSHLALFLILMTILNI